MAPIRISLRSPRHLSDLFPRRLRLQQVRKSLSIESRQYRGRGRKQSPGSGAQEPWNKTAGEAQAKHPSLKDAKQLAQSTDLNKPQAACPAGQRPDSPSDAGSSPARNVPVPARSGHDPQMVKEVRPPVTPPTPDPRLVVHEITELKFIQSVTMPGWMVRGENNLDYR